MPNRDYASRLQRRERRGNKWVILGLVLLLIGTGVSALWWLKASAPIAPQTAPQPQPNRNKLPSPPEQIYSYIRDLENREVPLDKNAKFAVLTREQEQLLQKQKEEEQRRQALLAQQQALQNPPQEVTQTTASATNKPTDSKPTELKTDKGRPAEKPSEEMRKTELKKAEAAKKEAALKAKTEPEKPLSKEPPKTVAKPTEPAKTGGRFGLQCGAFKNKTQAENMQARLSMAGFQARINSNGEWNRVVVGPVGDRAAASQAQANARSVAECLIVAM